MRVTLLALCVLTAAPLVGCKKVTKEQGTAAFHKELHLYFNNLNNEAQFRKDEFRKAEGFFTIFAGASAGDSGTAPARSEFSAVRREG